MECRIQSLSRGKVVSKGLLDNDSRISDAAGFCERLDDTCKEIRWNCQIMRRVAGRANRFLQKIEGRWFFIIAPDIPKQLQQFSQDLLIDLAALLLDAIAHAFF